MQERYYDVSKVMWALRAGTEKTEWRGYYDFELGNFGKS